MIFIGTAVVHLSLVVHHLQVTRLQPEVQFDLVSHLPKSLQGRLLGGGQGGHACVAAWCGGQLVVRVVEGDGQVALSGGREGDG
jgi:hypothetical protein